MAVSDQLAPQVLQGHGRDAVVLQLADNGETRTVLGGTSLNHKKTTRKEKDEEYESQEMATWSSGVYCVGWTSGCYRLW